jgi:MATE family multidrug resistance protein
MMNGMQRLWGREGGYREVLYLAVPLILSTGSHSIQHFVDRMFLTWYSPSAIAASTPAGMLNFTLMSLFIGTAGYVNTFVAQYSGARRFSRIGPAVWQGIYFSLIGGVCIACMYPLAPHFFRIADHEAGVQILEVHYFRILCLGATPAIMASALAGFFSGRRKTWTVMWVNVVATLVNITLNYCLIFGHCGLPELGIRGAALATVLSALVSCLIYFVLFTRPENRARFSTMHSIRPEKELFGRLLRYGFPNGVHFMMDMLSFTLFIMFVGRFGMTALAATNIAFNINTLAFMPMLGFSITTSVLVGQRLGENKPQLAERSTWSAFHMTFLYMFLISAAYVLVPGIFIQPFAAHAEPAEFAVLMHTLVVLLRFVAVYSLFDTLSIVFSGALKGAGDTRFVLFASLIQAWIVMVIPAYLSAYVFSWGLYVTWGFVTCYIVSLGVTFFLRFLRGKWKTMRVIEEAGVTVSAEIPEVPAIE